MRTYTTYRFINKDPMIDKLRTALQAHFAVKGKQGKISYKDVEVKSGVRAQTYRSWFEGKTRRPQGATLIATARSIPGWDIDLLSAEEVTLVHQKRKKKNGHA